jgi:Tfp pilus assembly protein PilF
MPTSALIQKTVSYFFLTFIVVTLAACSGAQHAPGTQKPQYNEARAISLAESYRRDSYFNKAQSILSPFANSEAGSAAAKIEYAQLQLAMQAPDTAEIYARDALKINSDSLNALHILAIALSAQDKTAEAHKIYKKALGISDRSPELLNDFALNLAEQGLLKEAIETTKKSLEIDSSHQDSLRNLRIFETLLASKVKLAPEPKEKKKAPPKPEVKPNNSQ